MLLCTKVEPVVLNSLILAPDGENTAVLHLIDILYRIRMKIVMSRHSGCWTPVVLQVAYKASEGLINLFDRYRDTIEDRQLLQVGRNSAVSNRCC